jgi:hypothetical protein
MKISCVSYVSSETAALLLPRKAFEHLNRLSLLLMWCIPPLFILIKIFDRLLSERVSHGWSWCIKSGFFSKIDDLSFWIIIAGLLATRNIMKARILLSSSTSGSGEVAETITSSELKSILWVIFAASGIYVAVRYPTHGTFFNPAIREQRAAQVLEGLMNLALVPPFYIYLMIGHLTLRRAERLIAEKNPKFTCAERKRCAELIGNAPCVMLFAALGGALLFPVIKWAGDFIFKKTHSTFWNWELFQPEPWSEVLFGWIGGVFIVFLYFLPWFVLIKPAGKILCDGCRFRFNWLWMVGLVLIQQAPTTMLIFILKEMLGKQSEFGLVLKVLCEPATVLATPVKEEGHFVD